MQAWDRDVAGTGIAGSDASLFRSAVSTLQAKSLAIVGASERARWASDIFKNLREFGYPGRIALINPRQVEVYGERCFPSLRDLPDLVVAHREGVGASQLPPPKGRDERPNWTVLVGPEGGLSPAELDLLSAAPRLSIGPQVLRAVTAPVAAVAVLMEAAARLRSK